MGSGGPRIVVRVLCAGDLHIGRRASKLPTRVDAGRFSAREAWNALVDVAIRERADLVALSGDLVDRANRYFEAVGPLEQGFRRLAEAGVAVCMVAGNHDYDVLPVLIGTLRLDSVTLLGAGGRWQRHTLTRHGAPVLHVEGWSFPDEHVRGCPLDDYALPPADDAPVLGLLHADLDQPASNYAPVTLAGLRSQRVALWLLGHVHAPSWRAAHGAPGVLYPGSPGALDPGEPGVHGVWLVDIEPGRPAEPRLLPLSRVCYATLDIALDGVQDVDEARWRIFGTVREHLRATVEACAALECVSYRVTLRGRTAAHGFLDATRRELAADFEPQQGGTLGYIERAIDATRPPFDLAELRGRRDALGALARLLTTLESGADADAGAPLDAVLAQLRVVSAQSVFGALDDDERERTPEQARELLLGEGYRLLDALHAQRERA